MKARSNFISKSRIKVKFNTINHAMKVLAVYPLMFFMVFCACCLIMSRCSRTNEPENRTICLIFEGGWKMHIPDGYLSPQTALPFMAIMVPVWGAAVKKVKQKVKKKHVPILAIGAAFSFTIMMFNLPIPGGSSAHATGAVLLSILLGPWAACLGVSTALIIQALVFGDGGILAVGANCFNIAFVMPLTGYLIYKLVKGNAAAGSGRGLAAAALAGYVGLNMAALFTALEFGSQYHLFQSADGTPLYFMYPIKVAVAAMMSEHLLLAGPVEALVTSLGLRFVGANYPDLLSEQDQAGNNLALEVSQNV